MHVCCERQLTAVKMRTFVKMAAAEVVRLLHLLARQVVATKSEKSYFAHMQRSCAMHAAMQHTNCKWGFQLQAHQEQHPLDNNAWLVSKSQTKKLTGKHIS